MGIVNDTFISTFLWVENIDYICISLWILTTAEDKGETIDMIAHMHSNATTQANVRNPLMGSIGPPARDIVTFRWDLSSKIYCIPKLLKFPIGRFARSCIPRIQPRVTTHAEHGASFWICTGRS